MTHLIRFLGTDKSLQPFVDEGDLLINVVVRETSTSDKQQEFEMLNKTIIVESRH